MKNKKTAYYGAFIGLIGTIVMIVIFTLCSCSTHKYVSSRKTWKCELQPLGTYDTSSVIRENFLKGNTTIIYLQDDSCIVIWGKKCEFIKGDSLFAKAEWWATPPGGSHWKYFLVNKEKTIRYSLLNRQ